MQSRAQNFLVASDQSYNEAGDIISWIAERLKKIEARRIHYVKPLNDHVKDINAEHKGYTQPFQEADRIIREKMMSWRRAEEAYAQAGQERIEKEAKKLAKETGVSVEEIMASAEVPEAIKETTNSTVAKRWVFEIIDMSKVPRNFLCLDEKSVNINIREGVRNIPGLRIYQEESIKLK